MENDKEFEELLTELNVIETVVRENPCGMPKSVVSSLKAVLNDFIGKHCLGGGSREQVAKYLGRDVRTLSRWKSEYPDFPEARHDGHREISYNWMDVVRWKLKHKDLFD